MDVDKDVYTASLGAVAAVLGGLVVFDIYDDWLARGFGFQSALVENSVPLVFVGALFYATYWVHTSGSRQHAATMTQWAILGLGGFVLITGWITAIQVLQQELQPFIVLTHTAIGGAVAGVLIGYGAAERERSQEDLQRRTQRFEALFTNDPAAITDVFYEDGTLFVQRTNPSFQQAFGVTDATQGVPLFDLLDVAETDTVEEVRSHVENRQVYEGSATVQNAEEGRYFTLRVAPYSSDGASVRAYAILADVTELQKTKLRLQESVDELEESNERLQQFAYVASHDLQEPVRMVSSYMRLLDDEYGDELDEEAQEYIDFAVDGADRMREMIDDLLAYSRVRRQAEPFTEVDADAVLDETLQDLKLRLEEADATVTSEPLPVVEADRSQLGQLFQNLIENAVSHAEDAPEIHIGCRQKDDEFVFSVADDGPGIPEAQQEKVFQLFKQGERDGEGTGIGLAICDRIVSRHDGDIWVESSEGEGATFYFSIPNRQ